MLILLRKIEENRGKYMKKLSLVSLITLAISTAHAGVYMAADVGYSKIHTGNTDYTVKGDNSSGVIDSSNKSKDLEAVKLGYAFNENVRTEMAFTRYGDVNKNYELTDPNDKTDIKRSVQSRSLMVNAYYDFNNIGSLQPYVMAGTGLVINKTNLKIGEGYANNSTKNYFGYQIGTGIGYKITDQLYADAGIKYAYLGKSLNDTAEIRQSSRISSVDATIGIRYAF